MPPAPEPTPTRTGVVVAQLAFVCVAALLVYGFVGVSKEAEVRRECSAACYLHPDYMAAERKAPNFALKGLNGATVTLDSLRGKVVLLNFWSKSCGPCLEEMPSLAELAQVVHDRSDVVVLAVSIDDGPEDVNPTLKTVLRGPPPFTVLFDPDAKIVQSEYGTHLFPETWLIDKKGIIRARFDGAREWNNPLVVNLIDGLRGNDYCPVKIDGKTLSGKAGRLCEEMQGT
jgi:thiol-disulfide isomerase/thioredoxin